MFGVIWKIQFWMEVLDNKAAFTWRRWENRQNIKHQYTCTCIVIKLGLGWPVKGQILGFMNQPGSTQVNPEKLKKKLKF